jgi:hypothetical protein
LNKTEYRKLKCLITKQITDDEKVILAGIDPTFTIEIENIDKGSFKLRDFQDKLAANASRFQSKKYTPDSRILTYLKVRAQEFNVPVPSFMKKRLPNQGKGSQPSKRGRSNMQQNRVRSHQAYLQQPIPSGASVPTTTSTAPTFMSPKGKGKEKGRLKVNEVIALKVKAIFFKKEPHIPRAKVLLKANLTKDHLKEIVPILEVPPILVLYVISVICMVTYHRIVVNVRHCTTLRLTNKLGVNLIHDSNYL